MKSEERRVKSEERRVKSEERRVKSEERRVKSEERRVKGGRVKDEIYMVCLSSSVRSSTGMILYSLSQSQMMRRETMGMPTSWSMRA